jgi:hypothetical protein
MNFAQNCTYREPKVLPRNVEGQPNPQEPWHGHKKGISGFGNARFLLAHRDRGCLHRYRAVSRLLTIIGRLKAIAETTGHGNHESIAC